MTDRLVRDSKRLSWLLRHGAAAEGVEMDAAGWVRVADVLAHLGLRRERLEEVVRRNDKRRLQLEGDRIRCCQGHSAESGVSRAALEASWARWVDDAPVWHGTSLKVLDAIAAEGIRPGGRTHVHLAASLHSRVGKRAAVDVLLAVDPAALREAGFDLFAAPNGVLLAREVPARCISGIEPRSTRARKLGAAALWERFVARRGA